MFFCLIPSKFFTMISFSTNFNGILDILTGSTLYYIPLPGSEVFACHDMLKPIVDLHLVDQHCCQLLPKHILHFISSELKTHW